MNILKFFAGLFSRKAPAKTPSDEYSEWKNSSKPNIEDACIATKIGELEHTAFAPQPLMSWYCMYKAAQTLKPTIGNIDQVQVLDIFNPHNSIFIGTIFAITGNDGYIWSFIGSKDVYASTKDAFFYRVAKNFRVTLAPKDNNVNYRAVCCYKKHQILVTQILEEQHVPPTDNNHETIVPCKKLLPCNLATALAFVKSLKK